MNGCFLSHGNAKSKTLIIHNDQIIIIISACLDTIIIKTIVSTTRKIVISISQQVVASVSERLIDSI